MKQLITIVASVLIYTSCQQQENSLPQTNAADTATLTQTLALPESSQAEEAAVTATDPVTSTFIAATGERKPVYLTSVTETEQQREAIIGVINKSEFMYSRYEIIAVGVDYSSGASKVTGKVSQSYGKDGTSIEIIHPFQLATLSGGQPYIYFASKDNEYGSGAAGLSTLRFNLYTPVTNQLFTLVYDAEDVEDGKVEGEFINLDDFAYDKELLQYLLKRADTCRFIRHPEEVNIEDPAEYKKKWKAENPTVPDVFNADGGVTDQIIFPSYDQAPIPFSEAVSVIENEDFKVADFFRGSVFAESKTSGMYYLVWLEGCNHGCEKEISFTEDGKLKITYEAQPVSVMIDLKYPAYTIIK